MYNNIVPNSYCHQTDRFYIATIIYYSYFLNLDIKGLTCIHIFLSPIHI